jgi:hypothetical protein
MKEDRFSKIKRNKFLGNQKIGFGESFVDTKELVPTFSVLFESLADAEWAVREATSDGPNQRQIRNALILKQVSILIKQLNLTEAVATTPIVGTSPKEYDFEYPIGIPKEVLDFISKNIDDTQSWLGQGPFHEVAFDLLLMNCLSAVNKKIKEVVEANETKFGGRE